MNRTVHELCKRDFAKSEFAPPDVREAWEQMEQVLTKSTGY